MRRLTFALLAALLTACAVPQPRQAVSPLPLPTPAQSFSPLPLPAPSTPRTAILASPRGFVPIVAGGGAVAEDGCSLNATAAAMLEIIRTAEWQGRINARCDPWLAAAAQAKADHMADYVYVSHISPNGLWANDWVRLYKFYLPPWFAPGANNVESVAGGFGYFLPEIAITAWATSEGHWNHVAADLPYFAAHDCIAVGYSHSPGRGFVHYWTFYSAECPD